ncbi:MAG TPA: VOC family protein [Pseudonocardiaceae bacterium]
MDINEPLTRQASSDAVTHLGWRHVLGTLITSVPVPSLAGAAEIAAAVASVGDADTRLRLDLRADRVEIVVGQAQVPLTGRDVALVERISAVVPERGPGTHRTVQSLEIAIDAIDIPAVLPFWRAALGYVDESSNSVRDPIGQGPAVWFQQMDAPRPQRNRIHLDISVPHDEASDRIRAALAAGGVLVSDAEAPAFWVLADREGNEACITTWQGRD